MPRKVTKFKIPLLWIILWIAIFVAILALGNFYPDSQITTVVRLSGVTLCLLYSALHFSHDYSLLAALAATCLADVILAGNNISPIGVAIFIPAQLFHLIHTLKFYHPKERMWLFSYLGLVITLLVLDIILDFMPILYLASGLYAVLLIANLIISYLWRKKQPGNRQSEFAFFGFLLFASCDACTVLSYLSRAAVLPASFYALANFLVWFFYYPSQIFLSNTGKYDIMAEKEGKK